jgi:hypothetical protein
MFVLRRSGREQGDDLLAAHARKEVGVERVAFGPEFIPEPSPAEGLGRLAVFQRVQEAQARRLDLLIADDVAVDRVVRARGRRVVLIPAPPAVFSGAAAEGREAEVMTAADGLGVEPRQLVVPGLNPDLGRPDAVGVGHSGIMERRYVKFGRRSGFEGCGDERRGGGAGVGTRVRVRA